MAEKARIVLTAEDQTRQAFSSVQRNLEGMQRAVSQIRNVGGALLGAELVRGLGEGARAIVQARVEFEKLQNTLGQAVGAARVGQELAFIRQTTQRLGLEFNATANSYAKFAAASRGTALEGQQTREVFIGISQAATALGLSSEETAGALTAIQQIISKGKVSAEELRGQLGERLPGAFQIAARSIGVTTQELDKLLQTGSLTADDFLPKFGRQLQTEFADAAKRAADSTQASLNRIQSAWNDLKRTLSQGPAGEAAAEGLSRSATSLQLFADRARDADKSAKGLFDRLAAFAPPIGLTGLFAQLRASQLATETRTTASGTISPAPLPALPNAGLRALDNTQTAAQAQADREALRKLQQQFRSPQQVRREQIEELRRLGASTGEDVSAQIAEIRRRDSTPQPRAREVEDYDARIRDRVASVVNDADIVKAREFADTLKGLDKLFFEGGLAADVYESAVAKLARTTSVAGEDGFGKINRELTEQAAKWRDVIDPLAKYTRQLEEVRALVRAGKLTRDEGLTAEFKIEGDRQDDFERVRRGAKETEDVLKGLNLTFDTTFEDVVLGTRKVSDAFKALANDIARGFLRKNITEPVLGALFGTGKEKGVLSGLFDQKAIATAIRGLVTLNADGGVMTSRGPLPLRKYAGGGIARSAQVAVFGEGDRPEAYVPLPDGRSIPVTMSGASVVQNISVSGEVSRGDIANALSIAVAQAKRDILQSQNRRGAFA